MTNRATRAQVVAINAHFWHMGYRRADRPDRLAACAALLGLDELASTNDLRLGQAGKLVRELSQLHDDDALREAIAAASTACIGPTGTEAVGASDAPACATADAGALTLVLAYALCAGAWRRPPGPAGS